MKIIPLAGALLAILLFAAACSDGEGDANDDGGAAATGATLSANNATVAELQAAFEAAGISNARQWAREVEEYRPYPEDDPGFAKLRRELGKYNPGPGVMDAIIALLHLP